MRSLARCNKATTVGWPLCSSPKVTLRERAEDSPGKKRGGNGRKTLVCFASRPLFARPELEELQQMRGKNPPDGRTDGGTAASVASQKIGRTRPKRRIRSCRGGDTYSQYQESLKFVSSRRKRSWMGQELRLVEPFRAPVAAKIRIANRQKYLSAGCMPGGENVNRHLPLFFPSPSPSDAALCPPPYPVTEQAQLIQHNGES